MTDFSEFFLTRVRLPYMFATIVSLYIFFEITNTFSKIRFTSCSALIRIKILTKQEEKYHNFTLNQTIHYLAHPFGCVPYQCYTNLGRQSL